VVKITTTIIAIQLKPSLKYGMTTNRAVYSGLDLEKREIRVVILQPAEDITTLVECELKTISLSSDFEYEALSYEWGNLGHAILIQLDGEEFEVWLNLHNALRRLRQKSSPRILWIDVICINQQDTEEKNMQVPMTGDIYRGARQVVAFLGDGGQVVYESVDALIEMGKDNANHLLSSMTLHINPDAPKNCI
jgi:hypothetical protein